MAKNINTAPGKIKKSFRNFLLLWLSVATIEFDAVGWEGDPGLSYTTWQHKFCVKGTVWAAEKKKTNKQTEPGSKSKTLRRVESRERASAHCAVQSLCWFLKKGTMCLLDLDIYSNTSNLSKDHLGFTLVEEQIGNLMKRMLTGVGHFPEWKWFWRKLCVTYHNTSLRHPQIMYWVSTLIKAILRK